MSLYPCARCKGKFPFENIRYDKNGKIVCLDCMGTEGQLKSNSHLDRTASDRTKYICMHCRFKFSLKEETEIKKRCPNCGNARLMEVKKYKDVNDLIQDSMDPRFDH